jgi:GMP synthase (glutamine-hydrolysing)
MKRQPVILKLGSTLPDLAARRGDFEDWILTGLGWPRATVRIVDPTAGDPLPEAAGVPGIVITGSHAMVTDHEAWSDAAAAWLRTAVAQGVPILGICYGHQLIADALGGAVADNPRGREFGTVAAALQPAARDDPLLGGLDGGSDTPQFHVHACHTQSVVRLPAGARILAASARDPHLAYRLDGAVWGVQFHPEFDADVVRHYIRAFAPTLRDEGQNPGALLATCRDTPHGTTILRRFARIVEHEAGGRPA